MKSGFLWVCILYCNCILVILHSTTAWSYPSLTSNSISKICVIMFKMQSMKVYIFRYFSVWSQSFFFFFQSAAPFYRLTMIHTQKSWWKVQVISRAENVTTKIIFLITHVLIILEFGIGTIKIICRGRKAKHN